MTSTPRQRRSTRSSVFGALFGSGERYEVHSGCFGQYGSAWRCPTGCTLEINSEKVREATRSNRLSVHPCAAASVPTRPATVVLTCHLCADAPATVADAPNVPRPLC